MIGLRNAPEGASIAKVNARINARWKQINASNQMLQRKANTGDGAKVVGDSKIIDHDPVHGMLYKWEIEYQKNQQARANAHLNGHSNGRDK